MGGIAPILYQGAIPIFADVDPVTLNVTPEAVAGAHHQAHEAPSSRRTSSAIRATSSGIKAVGDTHGIPVIEDCAQAFLATQNGKLVGTIGAIGAFSLQQGKHMTTGEGGLVVTSDKAYARWMILFSDKAWGYGDPKPDHYFLALNYRMTDLQGAVARAQLAKLDGVGRAPAPHRGAADRAPHGHARSRAAEAGGQRDARLLEVPADRRPRP
jgi:dTDP-4-amino-4,6-dideoxygalactose transaminase